MLNKQEFRERTAHNCSYEEYKACCCQDCDKTNCVHRDAYRRLPKIDGGLGLCPNLATLATSNNIKEETNNEI